MAISNLILWEKGEAGKIDQAASAREGMRALEICFEHPRVGIGLKSYTR